MHGFRKHSCPWTHWISTVYTEKLHGQHGFSFIMPYKKRMIKERQSQNIFINSSSLDRYCFSTRYFNMVLSLATSPFFDKSWKRAFSCGSSIELILFVFSFRLSRLDFNPYWKGQYQFHWHRQEYFFGYRRTAFLVIHVTPQQDTDEGSVHKAFWHDVITSLTHGQGSL